MIVTHMCAGIIIEDLKYCVDLLPWGWFKTSVKMAQNLRESGSLSPESPLVDGLVGLINRE